MLLEDNSAAISSGSINFSVVIPVYNCERYITRSVQSVLDQTTSSLELIIVDDGSTDGTYDILKSLRDDRIKIIRQRNQGVSAARNAGIDNASHEWICFLDADDRWDKDHLNTLKEMIISWPEKLVFATAHRRQLPDGTVMNSNEVYSQIKGVTCLTDLFSIISKGYSIPIICTDSICIKREVLSSVGGFAEGVKIGEDVDLWYRIAAKYDIVYSSKITSTYYRDASEATRAPIFAASWPFEDRCRSYIYDSTIPEDKRKHIKDFYNLHMISRGRQYLLIGDRKGARKALGSVIPPVSQKKYLLITRAAFIFPHRLISFVARRKNRKYYRDN